MSDPPIPRWMDPSVDPIERVTIWLDGQPVGRVVRDTESAWFQEAQGVWRISQWDQDEGYWYDDNDAPWTSLEVAEGSGSLYCVQ